MAKRNIEYGVHAHWKFLSETYGIEEAFEFFGPYKGAIIKPRFIDKDTIEVTMPLELTNVNYVGTHFGGSLYSMCDPFFMFLLMKKLGPQYMVWDKSAKVEFIKPGTGLVRAIFYIPDSEIEAILTELTHTKKLNRFYTVEVKQESEIIARVEKELYIRRLVK